jgi:hypothetical protein
MGSEIQDDPEHARVFPDRKCSVGTAACRGRVTIVGPAMMCAFHVLRWDEDDWNGREERMRAWVRAERTKGATP